MYKKCILPLFLNVLIIEFESNVMKLFPSMIIHSTY